MKSTIAYDRFGTRGGTPVLLVHGIGHRRQAWGRVPEILAERGYDVITLDLPGHGESPVPQRPDSYSPRSTTEQIQRLCHDLGVRRPHVIGNSLGGFMALHLAAQGKVASVVAISPAGFYPPHHLMVVGPQLLMMKLSTLMPDSLYRRIVSNPRQRKASLGVLYRHPEVLSVEDCVGDKRNLQRSKGFWPHFIRATFHRFTRQPQVSTTITWGAQDRLLLPSQAEVARGRFRSNPLVSVTSLEDAGHCGQVDQPEEIVATLERTMERAHSLQSRPMSGAA